MPYQSMVLKKIACINRVRQIPLNIYNIKNKNKIFTTDYV